MVIHDYNSRHHHFTVDLAGTYLLQIVYQRLGHRTAPRCHHSTLQISPKGLSTAPYSACLLIASFAKFLWCTRVAL